MDDTNKSIDTNDPDSKTIRMIVLTGGPCAGKSTAIREIKAYFETLGYTVLCIAETATELIVSGIAPWTTNTNFDYQLGQFKLQLAKEEVYLTAARNMPDKKILIICDRGLMDNYAYTSAPDMERILDEAGLSPLEMQNRYDAVFHLETAAKGGDELYGLDTNTARTETPDKAIALDNSIIDAWNNHPHLRIIASSQDFADKLNTLIREIELFLGE